MIERGKAGGNRQRLGLLERHSRRHLCALAVVHARSGWNHALTHGLAFEAAALAIGRGIGFGQISQDFVFIDYRQIGLLWGNGWLGRGLGLPACTQALAQEVVADVVGADGVPLFGRLFRHRLDCRRHMGLDFFAHILHSGIGRRDFFARLGDGGGGFNRPV